MTAKAKIKVIKKSELNTAEPSIEKEQKPTQAPAREIVSTVSNWVSDFRERKSQETKQAFEILFSAQPKTSEV